MTNNPNQFYPTIQFCGISCYNSFLWCLSGAVSCNGKRSSPCSSSSLSISYRPSFLPLLLGDGMVYSWFIASGTKRFRFRDGLGSILRLCHRLGRRNKVSLKVACSCLFFSSHLNCQIATEFCMSTILRLCIVM
jgi:hypothetical protein